MVERSRCVHGVAWFCGVGNDKLEEWKTSFRLEDVRGCSLTSPPFTGHLVGRDSEILRVIQFLSNPTNDRPAVIATAAPPGSGKSALMQKIAEVFLNVDTEENKDLLQRAAAGNAKRMTTLKKLFPVPITWNHHTRFVPQDETFVRDKDGNVRLDTRNTIAVRVAFSMFQAHVLPEINFSAFIEEWSALEHPPKLDEILQAVQDCVRDKELLFIVDEPAKTKCEAAVRNQLYSAWLANHKNARMFISSLNPTELKGDFLGGRAKSQSSEHGDTPPLSSDFLMQFVQLSRGSEKDLECVVSSIDWIRKDARIRALVRFMFAMSGHSWRAKYSLYQELEVGPQTPNTTLHGLETPQAATKFAYDAMSAFFPDVSSSVDAVTDLLILSVLKRKVCLDGTQTAATEEAQAPIAQVGGQHPSSWLLGGILSNAVPVWVKNGPPREDVPELSLVVVYEWLKLGTKPKAEAAGDVVGDIADLRRIVGNLFENSQLCFNHCVTGAALRFEKVTATWLQLLFVCARKRSLQNLPFESVFPGFEAFSQTGKAARVPVLPIPNSPVQVYELQHKLSGDNDVVVKGRDGTDSGVTPTDLPSPGIYLVAATEPAVDVVVWVGVLILIQCRLYNKPMTRSKLQGDLLRLSKFRNKLWLGPGSTSTDPPCQAKNLGLPAIPERDVVFVLLAPNGLCDRQNRRRDRQNRRRDRDTGLLRKSLQVSVVMLSLTCAYMWLYFASQLIIHSKERWCCQETRQIYRSSRHHTPPGWMVPSDQRLHRWCTC